MCAAVSCVVSRTRSTMERSAMRRSEWRLMAGRKVQSATAASSFSRASSARRSCRSGHQLVAELHLHWRTQHDAGRGCPLLSTSQRKSRQLQALCIRHCTRPAQQCDAMLASVADTEARPRVVCCDVSTDGNGRNGAQVKAVMWTGLHDQQALDSLTIQLLPNLEGTAAASMVRTRMLLPLPAVLHKLHPNLSRASSSSIMHQDGGDEAMTISTGQTN